MSRGRASKLRPIALGLASCALALLIGIALFRSDPLAARSSPTSSAAPFVAAAMTPGATATATIVAVSTATAFPSPLASPSVTATASVTPLPMAVRTTAATLPPSPTVLPRVVIGRWQDHTVIITEAFVARGPWRICWAQPDPAIAFQVMVGDPAQTAWEFFSAPTGATSGHFDLPQGGAYRLMIHGETPYDVIVVERPSAGGPVSPLCQ